MDKPTEKKKGKSFSKPKISEATQEKVSSNPKTSEALAYKSRRSFLIRLLKLPNFEE